MRIGINMLVTSKAFSGFVSYIKDLLESLAKLDHQNKYFILINPGNKEKISTINLNDNFEYVIFNFPTFAYLRGLWEQFLLPLFLKEKRVDVLYCPGNTMPIFSSSKTVVLIGTIGPFCKDIYADKNLSICQKVKYRLNRFMIVLSAKRADIVIFESNYARNLFVKSFKIDRNKTKVIHHGKNEIFKPIINSREIEKSKEKFAIKGKYILCVSHLHRYKNFLRLIQAFDKIKNKIPEDIKLVVAGKIVDKNYFNEIRTNIKNYNLEDRISFVGEVPHSDLLGLYSGCLFFVFPSLCENHSYALVEALSCGTPIVCSNVTAMPETCKDAALYFNPYDVDDISMKMLEMIRNRKLRQLLCKKAIERARTFPSYDQIAFKTLEIFEEVSKIR